MFEWNHWHDHWLIYRVDVRDNDSVSWVNDTISFSTFLFDSVLIFFFYICLNTSSRSMAKSFDHMMQLSLPMYPTKEIFVHLSMIERRSIFDPIRDHLLLGLRLE